MSCASDLALGLRNPAINGTKGWDICSRRCRLSSQPTPPFENYISNCNRWCLGGHRESQIAAASDGGVTTKLLCSI